MVEIVSPIDGAVLAQRPLATEQEVDAALACARDAQPTWGEVTLAERARYCHAAVDAMLAMESEIGEAAQKISVNEKDLQSATEIRDKEAADFATAAVEAEAITLSTYSKRFISV